MGAIRADVLTGKAAAWLSMTFAVMLLLGCTPTVTQHGHRILEDDLQRIETGRSSMRDVLAILGSPSAQATFDNDRWYYVDQRSEQVSFYQSQVTKQDVITIVFSDRGVVQAVERLDLADARSIDPEGEKTRTLGNELSIFEQLVGNIGRFSTQEGAQ